MLADFVESCRGDLSGHSSSHTTLVVKMKTEDTFAFIVGEKGALIMVQCELKYRISQVTIRARLII